MAKKFEIVNNALQITDTVTTEVLLYLPARDAWFNENKLDNDIVSIYGVNGHAERKVFDLSECTDSNDVSFTKDTFRTFASTNLGKSSGGSTSSTTGWVQYGDSNYTEANPLTVSVGTTEVINIDGLSNTIKTQLPIGVTDLYDVTTSKITPVSVGDYYSLSLQFNGKSSSNNGDATIFIDIGGVFTRLFPSTFRFNRGAGTAHEYYFTFNFYSLDTFLANGGLIKIESGTGNTEIYDILIQIQKTHQGR